MLKRSIAMACNLESYVIMLWRVISVKLDTDKKITEIMTLNYKKNLACFHTYRTDIYGGVTLLKADWLGGH